MSDKPKRRLGRPPKQPPPPPVEPRRMVQMYEERAQASRKRAARQGRLLPDTPMGEAQAAAHAWVRAGVRRISVATMPNDCLVLMAATHDDTGKVGVAAEVRCQPLEALAALGKLVGEVNAAFMRDNVRVRARLVMHELPAEGPAAEEPA